MRISKTSKANKPITTFLVIGAVVACAAGAYMLNTAPPSPKMAYSHAGRVKVTSQVRKQAKEDSEKIVADAVMGFVDIPTFIDELMKAVVALAPSKGINEVSAEDQAYFKAQLVAAFDEAAKSKFFGDEATFVSRFKELLADGKDNQVRKARKHFNKPVNDIVKILGKRLQKGRVETEKKMLQNEKQLRKRILAISKGCFGMKKKFKKKTPAA